MKGFMTAFRILLAAAAISVTAEAGPCAARFAAPDPSFGHDESGYWVRIDPDRETSSRVARRSVVQLGDYLAQEAGGGVIFVALTTSTRAILGAGEWRGKDPLSALTAFATAGGLQVDVPSPNVWVVGLPDVFERTAFTLFAQPMDATPPASRSDEEAARLESALVRKLPVRHGAFLGDIAMGVSYYWLPDEGPDMLLVIGSVCDPNFGVRPCNFWVFKVRLAWQEGEPHVDCLWQGFAWGGLPPGGREDFDGDGYRDFLFAPGQGPDQPGAALSGRDGSTLFTTSSRYLAVEKAPTGPKAVASMEPFVDRETMPRVELLRFDETTGKYEAVERVKRATYLDAQAAGKNIVKDEEELLARELGDPDRVTVYELNPPPLKPFMVNRVWPGAPSKAHVLLRYEPAAFKERRKRLAAEEAARAASHP